MNGKDRGGEAADDRSAQDTSLYDRCRPLPTGDLPGEDQGLRRLLKKLEEKLAEYDETEATKKFGEDLKNFEKEYIGLSDISKKYEAFYDKDLACKLSEATATRKKIRDWCDTSDEETRKKIVSIWTQYYENVENEACRDWIKARDEYGRALDCLKQSERRADEAKEDFETIKTFEKTVKDRFADLQKIGEQGKAFNDKGELPSVCAAAVEYCAAFNELGVVETWAWRRQCGSRPESGTAGEQGGKETDKAQAQTTPSQQGAGQESEYVEETAGAQLPPAGAAAAEQAQHTPAQKPAPTPASPCDAKEEYPLKEQRTPEQYRRELTHALWALILTKYDHFRRWQERIEMESETKANKDTLDKIKKNRRDEFFGEVQDIPTKRSVANA